MVILGSGQFIATSAEVTPNGGLVRKAVVICTTRTVVSPYASDRRRALVSTTRDTRFLGIISTQSWLKSTPAGRAILDSISPDWELDTDPTVSMELLRHQVEAVRDLGYVVPFKISKAQGCSSKCGQRISTVCKGSHFISGVARTEDALRLRPALEHVRQALTFEEAELDEKVSTLERDWSSQWKMLVKSVANIARAGRLTRMLFEDASVRFSLTPFDILSRQVSLI